MARYFRRILTSIAVLVVVVAAGALATGRASFVTTSGVSMRPLYHQGDLVIVAKATYYKVGEIVAYKVPAEHLVILHRIIGHLGDRLVLKGDNNQSIDPTHPTTAEVVGRAVLLVPDGGIWLGRLTSPLALALTAFLLLTGAGAHTARRRRRKGESRQRETPRAHERKMPLATAPPWLRAAAAVTAVVGIVGVALAAAGWSRPVTKQATAAPVSLSMVFSYSASVRQTAAYDGTAVESPSPVFRKLAKIVDVQFAYRGIPGTVTVTAGLSTPGGWHVTVPLAATTTFGSTHDVGTVRLDLNALDAQAAAAARITGLPAQPLTVAVTPRVITRGGAQFAPTLLLSLTPLELTVVGNQSALDIAGSATERQTVAVPQTLGALGRHITVARARTVSSILLLAALLGAALLVLFALLSAPTSEGAGIRRRYAPLLVEVDPMPVSSRHAVIDVTAFNSLTRLAEHYVSLVLHWTCDGIETFVVQADGATYRYRAGSGREPHLAIVDRLGDAPQPPDAPEFVADGRAEDEQRLADQTTRPVLVASHSHRSATA